MKENIFLPILENNITEDKEEKEEEEEDEEERKVKSNGRYVRDGARYSKVMEKEISKVINKKLYFPNFNILLYAQEYLMKYASDPNTME